MGRRIETKKIIVKLKSFSRFFFGNAKVVSPIEYGVVTAVLSTAMVTGLMAVGHAHLAVAQAPVIEVVQVVNSGMQTPLLPETVAVAKP